MWATCERYLFAWISLQWNLDWTEIEKARRIKKERKKERARESVVSSSLNCTSTLSPWFSWKTGRAGLGEFELKWAANGSNSKEGNYFWICLSYKSTFSFSSSLPFFSHLSLSHKTPLPYSFILHYTLIRFFKFNLRLTHSLSLLSCARAIAFALAPRATLASYHTKHIYAHKYKHTYKFAK